MFDVKALEWTRKPAGYCIEDGRVEIITKPHTDLWQRTYYHFRNDSSCSANENKRTVFFLHRKKRV